MAKIRFTKMHGLGNDYLFIDCIRADTPENPESLSKEMSDRHFGVGSDGIVLIMKPEDPKHTARMRIFNADGSEAEMCGNAIRCIAKYLYDNKLTSSKDMQIETLAGIIKPKIVSTKAGKANFIEVDMGIYSEKGEETVQADDREFTGVKISVGNPHFIIILDDLTDFQVERYGQIIEKDPAFPNRTNVEFVQVKNPDEILMRVWERGSGVTLACGTGASASAVATFLAKKTNNLITVHLLGGALQIKVNDDKHVFMTGPAEKVFEGEYEITN